MSNASIINVTYIISTDHKMDDEVQILRVRVALWNMEAALLPAAVTESPLSSILCAIAALIDMLLQE